MVRIFFVFLFFGFTTLTPLDDAFADECAGSLGLQRVLCLQKVRNSKKRAASSTCSGGSPNSTGNCASRSARSNSTIGRLPHRGQNQGTKPCNLALETLPLFADTTVPNSGPESSKNNTVVQ